MCHVTLMTQDTIRTVTLIFVFISKINLQLHISIALHALVTHSTFNIVHCYICLQATSPITLTLKSNFPYPIKLLNPKPNIENLK